MLKSEIRMINNVPRLFVDGKQTTAMAYTTYFEERSKYDDFLEAGYRIFFVNVSFTASPINSSETGFTPFGVGVFEDMSHPDYSEFEASVQKILNRCPDAIIFPRIYVSMPKWWTDAHPEETVLTPKGGYREALYSEKFREDAETLLVKLIAHIKAADYSDRIGGWMLCGGNTQEWFHHGHTGSLGKCADKPFAKWMLEKYGVEDAKAPAKEDFDYTDSTYNENENARRYAIFANEEVAKTVDFFAGIAKRETGRSQVVGVFYGYSLVNPRVNSGSHALNRIVDSDNLDFFASPNAYDYNRAFGIDWSDMIPVDSLKLHGKMAFIECDIRTYLTKSIQESRPGRYPADIYPPAKPGMPSVWSGPPTPELSREALRKSFAHQITKGSAIWWFDMFGGWYDDPILMDELARMKMYYDSDTVENTSGLQSEVIFISDEQGYANLCDFAPPKAGIRETRIALGNAGVPYDCYLVEDAEAVIKNYKAAVFPHPIPSDRAKRLMELCTELGIAYTSASVERYKLSAEELREFFAANGVHLYTEDKDVFYLGCGYMGFHSVNGGTKTIHLPKSCTVEAVYGTDHPKNTTDTVTFELKDNATALFRIR